MKKIVIVCIVLLGVPAYGWKISPTQKRHLTDCEESKQKRLAILDNTYERKVETLHTWEAKAVKQLENYASSKKVCNRTQNN